MDRSVGAASRAWYRASLHAFRADTQLAILGALAHASGGMKATERDAWMAEIDVLQAQTRGLDGSIFLEFSIPRMGRRIDAVLLIGSVAFVLEFKAGADVPTLEALDQVWDYALDLKNFHEASHGLPIAPILVPTEAAPQPLAFPPLDADGVYQPLAVAPRQVHEALEQRLAEGHGPAVDAEAWLAAPYRPTPTIIEAARALYAQHSVENIARHDAGAENLRISSARIEDLVREARDRRRKLICFVTGVPGAGKTLVGLNVATRRRDDASSPAVYLSGNGPLVAVLREALTRDELGRRRELGEKVRKGTIAESVKAFIQNVHHFRDEGIRNDHPPAENVAIFDEAQRAWTRKKTAAFMKRKRDQPDFEHSEPEFLISCMNRRQDWAVVVCLVGGGQEINDGEAGIDSWLDAVREHFPNWRMHISSRLTDSEYAAGQALERARTVRDVVLDDCLHLATSMRSFRSEKVSAFVKALLDRELDSATRLHEEVADRYPIHVTRDIEAAKEWVRQRARGSERYGLVASSKALRLKPHAVDVRVDVDPVLWFLNGKDDTRSSYYLEDAATEFQVQGLELDWTCVTWDADLRYYAEGWGFHDFRGTRWTRVHSADGRRYLLNAYRVLLTRARQGMVIFVPPGARRDATRPPEHYDATFAYLRSVGLPALT
jgi:hypothetical protein